MKIVVTGTRGIPNVIGAWRCIARSCFLGWRSVDMT